MGTGQSKLWKGYGDVMIREMQPTFTKLVNLGIVLLVKGFEH